MSDGTVGDDRKLSSDVVWLVPLVFATALCIASILHFGTEVTSLDGSLGPLAAFVITVTPCGMLVVVAVRLRGVDLSRAGKWTVNYWLVAGLLSGVALFGLTVAIRLLEGRALAEPEFPLLAAGGYGAVTGGGVGYLLARLRDETDTAREARDILAFTNRLLRHDLRNALQVIDGRAQLLSAGKTDPEEAAEAISSQTGVIRSLIDDVGSVAAVFQGTEDPRPMDLVPLVEAVVKNVREASPGAAIDLDTPPEASVVATDALRPVVRNLVSNATKHAGETPRVDVSVRTDGDTVRITVDDDGPGIPPSQRETIFETGASDRDGFGLYIVATIVAGFDGDVTVSESHLGGARFVVMLPAA